MSDDAQLAETTPPLNPSSTPTERGTMTTNETSRVAALEAALRDINPEHPLLNAPPPTAADRQAAAAARGKKRYAARMRTPGAPPGSSNLNGSWTTYRN